MGEITISLQPQSNTEHKDIFQRKQMMKYINLQINVFFIKITIIETRQLKCFLPNTVF